MFKKKYILLFTFFVALFFLLYLFTGFFTKIKEREVNLEGETKKLSETINKPVRKIYTLTPKLKYNEYFLTTTIDTYPYITTSPNDSLYPLILIKEKILLIIRKEKYWTIALKRLAEIHKWGNELSKVKIQNVLANFKTNTEDYLNAISKDRNERNRKIILLKNSLFLHRTELINIIRKLTLSSQDKKELLSFANKIFENLDEKIDFKLPPYNPNKLVYSLKSISPGYYDINPKNYSFQLDNAFPSTSANVKINNYSDLTLYIKNKSIFPKNDKWIEEYNDNEKNYKYSLIFSLDKNNYPYLIDIKYNISYLSSVELIQINKEDNRSKTIFSEYLYPNEDKKISKIITLDRGKNGTFQLNIYSEKKIHSVELAKTEIKLTPIFEPKIKLTKIKSIPAEINFFRYIITHVLLLFVFLSKLFLVIIKILAILLFILIIIQLKKIFPPLKYIFLFLTLSIIVKTLSGPILSLEVMSYIKEDELLFFIASYLLTIFTFDFNENVSLSISLLFILPCPFYIYNLDYIMAERFASFASLFLAIGAIHSFFSYIILRYQKK